MSTTAQQVVDRAVNRNTANRLSSLTSDSAEMLHQINAAVQSIRSQIAATNRTFYQTSATLTSSSGSSARTVDLTGASTPVFRVLKVELAGVEVSPVDIQDTDAELAPRYYQRGKTLVEVGTDWGTSGAKSLTVYYVAGVANLTIASGSLTQTVGIEDEYAWLLDNRLARYLAAKDTGRDPAELADLDAEFAQGMANYVEWMDSIAGTQVDRFDLPSPKPKT